MPLEPGTFPLRLVELPMPKPNSGDALVEISACEVCHAELDIIEGRTVPPKLPIILVYEVVGRIKRLGRDVSRHKKSARVSVGRIHSSLGNIDKNVDLQFRAAGRDVDGGYTEYMTIGENYAYPLYNPYG